MGPFRLMVARFPGMDQEHPASSGWIMARQAEWAADPRIAEVVPWRLADTPITMSRNRAVRDALAAGCDYLLMIDADMHPDVERGAWPLAEPFWASSWSFAMEWRAREASDPERVRPLTIAAPYCGGPPHENVYVFRWRNMETDNPDPDFALDQYTREEAAALAGIHPAAALPTGLILYDVRLFAALPKPWFDYEWTDETRSHKATTEDVYQTRNAALLGFPQFCNWSAWAGHVKPKLVRRPRPIGVEQVHGSLVEAVRSGRDGRRAVRFLHGPAPADRRQE